MTDRGRPGGEDDDTGEEGGFLSRWSRRKAAARNRPTPDPDVPDAAIPAAASDAPRGDEVADAGDKEPAPELPPLESLTKDSDYTQFLRKGVPKDLRLAALRKAWTTDPAIANFTNLNDYDWDFNAPGYGALLPTDDVQKLAARVIKAFETAAAPPDTEPPDTAPPDTALPTGAPAPPPALPAVEVAAPTGMPGSSGRPPEGDVLVPIGQDAPVTPKVVVPSAEPAIQVEDEDSLKNHRPRRPKHGGAVPL